MSTTSKTLAKKTSESRLKALYRHMEKQEMEVKWKLEKEMEMQPPSKIHMLLAFGFYTSLLPLFDNLLC